MTVFIIMLSHFRQIATLSRKGVTINTQQHCLNIMFPASSFCCFPQLYFIFDCEMFSSFTQCVIHMNLFSFCSIMLFIQSYPYPQILVCLASVALTLVQWLSEDFDNFKLLGIPKNIPIIVANKYLNCFLWWKFLCIISEARPINELSVQWKKFSVEDNNYLITPPPPC